MSAEITDLVFVRLAHVEHEQIVAAIAAALQLFWSDLRQLARSRRGRFLPADAAELLIVNQLRDGRMRAARGALGIFAQLELAEAHAERIHQQQPADERLAFAEDELDRL